MRELTSVCPALGVLSIFVGPGGAPVGTGTIVIVGITGGNGLISVGHIPNLIVPKIGKVISMQKGFRATGGKTFLVGDEPA